MLSAGDDVDRLVRQWLYPEFAAAGCGVGSRIREFAK